MNVPHKIDNMNFAHQHGEKINDKPKKTIVTIVFIPTTVDMRDDIPLLDIGFQTKTALKLTSW